MRCRMAGPKELRAGDSGSPRMEVAVRVGTEARVAGMVGDALREIEMLIVLAGSPDVGKTIAAKDAFDRYRYSRP